MQTITDKTAHSWPVRTGVFLYNRWIDIAQIVCPAVTTVCAILIGDEITAWLLDTESSRKLFTQLLLFTVILSTVIYSYVMVCHWKRQRVLSEMDSLNSDLESQNALLKSERHNWITDQVEILREYLHDFCYLSLKFGSESQNTERMTFFVHDGCGHFIPIIRISSNPRYATLGRPKIRDNEGCLGKAWEHDWFTVDMNDPETTTYKKESEKLGINEGVLQSLRMKSRCYVGYVVRRPVDQKRLGVVLVESTKHSRWYESNIRSKFEDGEFPCFLVRITQRVVNSMSCESNVSVF